MDILLATNNHNKVKEYQEILTPFNINVLCLKDLKINSDPKETGHTFKENSLIKAKALMGETTLPIIADDSGLIIDAIPDILGVNSARFMGKDTPYIEKNKKIIELLKDKDRSASFNCVITLITSNKDIYQFEGVCKGTIAFEIEGQNGFGYDPIFIPNGYDKTFGTFDEDEKNKISHRGIASTKLINFIKAGNKL